MPPKDIQKALDTNNCDLRRYYLELSDMVDYWYVDNPPWAVKYTAANTSRRTKPCLIDTKINHTVRRKIHATIQALREERRERLRSRITSLATEGFK